MTPVIEADHLRVCFGPLVAVDDLTLRVERGAVLALLGHNGAGKTTTIRALNGLIEPASGTARVFSLSPFRDGPALRRRVAVLTETATLDERLTARETLAIFADLYGVPAAGLEERIESLLGELGLAERIDDGVAGYSKGMKQRLALARALLHDPELLYLDEPTAGLDPAAARLVQARVRRWAREEGRTIVLCTHDLVEAQDLADHVGVLARGRLIALGSPAELRRRIAPSLSFTVEMDRAQVDQAMALIRGHDGLTTTISEEGLVTVTGATRDRIPDVVAALSAAGVRVYRVAPHEPSLADAYFALHAEGVEG